MHRRRLTKRTLADLPTGDNGVRRHVANWLAEDQPASPKTEPFDPDKCPYRVSLRPDTFTHHQGDYRGAVWEERTKTRTHRTLWLLAVGMHDAGYATACSRAADRQLYPEPSDLEDRDNDADLHDFAIAFCAAAQALEAAARGKREIQAGGYWAELELAYGPPKYGWVVGLRQTKEEAASASVWLDLGDLTSLVRSLFATSADIGDPTVSAEAFSVYEYPVFEGDGRTPAAWCPWPCESPRWWPRKVRTLLASLI